MFLVATQAERSNLVLRALPLDGPSRIPLESDRDEPMSLQAIFTPYARSELQQTDGIDEAPFEPTTTLAALEHEVFETQVVDGIASAWRSGTIGEVVGALGLRPQLCPEFEYEKLPYDSRAVIPVSEDRAVMLVPTELVWFERKGTALETRTVPLDGEGAAGLFGLHEDDNTFWLGGTELSRLVLAPRSLTRFASFGTSVVRDFVLLRAGTQFEGLVPTDEGDLYLVDTSTRAFLGRIPGDRGGFKSGGFAVSKNEGRYFAAAAGGASLFVYSRTEPLREERFLTLDHDGLAFGATSRNFGPMLVTRPVGDVYFRTGETIWTPTVRLVPLHSDCDWFPASHLRAWSRRAEAERIRHTRPRRPKGGEAATRAHAKRAGANRSESLCRGTR